MSDAIKTAIDALRSLPQDSLGHVPDIPDMSGWWIRDELVDALCKELQRTADMEAKLREVGELPDRWMSSKPTHDFGNGVTISYGGKSVDECADELRAILNKYKEEGK